MHDDFSDWYREAGLEPSAESLPKRSAGIEKFDPSPKDIVALAKMFFGLGASDAAFLAAFRAPFKEADVTFPMTKNDVELRVLSGAKLIDVIESANLDEAILAALVLVSTSFQNLRKGAAVAAIPGIAAAFLNKQSTQRMVAPDADDLSPLGQALTELGKPYDDFAIEFAKAQIELTVVSEETNMLWWLFSEASRDLKRPFSEVPLPAATIVAGKELADLTCTLPGPNAAMAFLNKIIRFSKAKLPTTVAVKDTINELPVDWRQTYVTSNWAAELESVAPLATGIKLSASSPDRDTWVPAFTASTGVPGSAKLAPSQISYQAFIEGLLGKSWRKSHEHA